MGLFWDLAKFSKKLPKSASIYRFIKVQNLFLTAVTFYWFLKLFARTLYYENILLFNDSNKIYLYILFAKTLYYENTLFLLFNDSNKIYLYILFAKTLYYENILFLSFNDSNKIYLYILFATTFKSWMIKCP